MSYDSVVTLILSKVNKGLAHFWLYLLQSILSNSPPVGKGSLGGLLQRMDY